MNRDDLEDELHRLDGRPYPAYKDLRGNYAFERFELSFDRIQGDPFAAPSRLSIRIDHSASQLPASLFSNPSCRVGTENALARAFDAACRSARSRTGSGKSGLIAIDAPEQEMLARSCLEIGPQQTTVRFYVGLPANGRRILGCAAAELLVDTLPKIVKDSLLYPNLDAAQLERFANTAEDADHLRKLLVSLDLVAFVADGAILPRASVVDQRPLPNAIPFRTPDTLRVEVELPHAGKISGMGIPVGITLIVGGGFHGKSTLLSAIERGVYNHRPGDGRELVVARDDAVKVRAEDGRAVAGVDLSPFINNLPGEKDTARFTTANASGSTSQAASIMEALEIGSRLLLIDEDISATNFLIRDSRMAQLITADREPITPFVRRARPLFNSLNVSTIVVLGGSSDYFAPAHRVIAMDNFLPADLTEAAKSLCLPGEIAASDSSFEFDLASYAAGRLAEPDSIDPYRETPAYRGSRSHGGGKRPPLTHVKARDTHGIRFGDYEIELSLISQLVSPSQTRAIGAALAHGAERGYFAQLSLREALQSVMRDIVSDGFNTLKAHDLAAFRVYELAAALNRLRSLRIQVALGSAPSS